MGLSLKAHTHLADLQSADSFDWSISVGRLQWIQNIKHVW